MRHDFYQKTNDAEGSARIDAPKQQDAALQKTFLEASASRGRDQTTCSSMTENDGRIEYAKHSIEELAREAVRSRRSGTVAVEISVKEGRLGRVKRLQIDFQPE